MPKSCPMTQIMMLSRNPDVRWPEIDEIEEADRCVSHRSLRTGCAKLVASSAVSDWPFLANQCGERMP